MSRPGIPHKYIDCRRCTGHGKVKIVDGMAMRYRREDAGITLGAMAARLGVSLSYMSEMELGKRAMSDKVARRMLEIIGQDTGGGNRGTTSEG